MLSLKSISILAVCFWISISSAVCQENLNIDTTHFKTGISRVIYSLGEDTLAYGMIKDGIKNGEWKGYFFNGSLRFSSQYSSGSINGVSKHYYPSGELKSFTVHKNGTRAKTWRSYYENGRFFCEVSWSSKGLPISVKLYSENGLPLLIKDYDYDKTECTISVERFYRNGSRLESYTTYMSLLKLQMELDSKGLDYLLDTTPNFGLPRSKEGKISGFYFRYFNSGKIWMHLEFDEGRLLEVITQNSASNSPIESDFSAGNGALIHFHHYGDTAAIYNYNNGLVHGPIKYFYTGNNTFATGEMLHGMPAYKWTIRSFSGKIKYTLDFMSPDTILWNLYGPKSNKFRLYPLVNGLLQGEGKEFDFYDQVAAEFSYENGLLDGPFTRWLNRNVTRFGSYNQGEQTGDWITPGLFNPVSHTTPFDQKKIVVNSELLPKFEFSLLPEIEMPRLKLPRQSSTSSYSRELQLYSENQFKSVLMELPDSDEIIGTTYMKLKIDENGNLLSQLPIKSPNRELLNFSKTLIRSDALFTTKFVLGLPDITYSYVIIEHFRN